MRAVREGFAPCHRGTRMKDAAIFLCAKTPVMAEPWAAAGYAEAG